jgi:cytochrome c553
MKKMLISLMAFGFLTSTASAMEAPAKANTCVGCHGADGNSLVANFPKIAGQHAAYLEKALKDYRDGFRKDPTMAAFARGLSDEEIKALAEYYSKQTPK